MELCPQNTAGDMTSTPHFNHDCSTKTFRIPLFLDTCISQVQGQYWWGLEALKHAWHLKMLNTILLFILASKWHTSLLFSFTVSTFCSLHLQVFAVYFVCPVRPVCVCEPVIHGWLYVSLCVVVSTLLFFSTSSTGSREISTFVYQL